MASALHFPEYVKVPAANAELTVEFCRGLKIEKVKVYNLSNNVTAEWNHAMDEGQAWKILADGTQSLETSNGFSLGAAHELKLGVLADLNDSTTEELLFEIWGR